VGIEGDYQAAAGVGEETTGEMSLLRNAASMPSCRRLSAVLTRYSRTLVSRADCDGGKAVRNITLSADERLIEAAREEARRRKTTLNAEFRAWLERYARNRQGERRVKDYRRFMEATTEVSAGRRFSRDESLTIVNPF